MHVSLWVLSLRRHEYIILQMSPWETITVLIVPKTVMLCHLPLHDWLALLSPSEATTSTQSKRPNRCPVRGASSQPPVGLLFNQWTHGQCGACCEHYCTQTKITVKYEFTAHVAKYKFKGWFTRKYKFYYLLTLNLFQNSMTVFLS